MLWGCEFESCFPELRANREVLIAAVEEAVAADTWARLSSGRAGALECCLHAGGAAGA